MKQLQQQLAEALAARDAEAQQREAQQLLVASLQREKSELEEEVAFLTEELEEVQGEAQGAQPTEQVAQYCCKPSTASPVPQAQYRKPSAASPAVQAQYSKPSPPSPALHTQSTASPILEAQSCTRCPTYMLSTFPRCRCQLPRPHRLHRRHNSSRWRSVRTSWI